VGTKLYVGNLAFTTSEASLRAAFSSDGRDVREVAVISDRETGRPRGFAFVQMGSEKDAQAAIAAWNGKELDGRALKVNEAQERPAGGGGSRGGMGGGGGGGRGGGGYGGGRDRRG
jgi:RNA recognition motif-containing protein